LARPPLPYAYELSSYKLKNITEGLKEIGIQLFESKENLEKYEYFLKEINLDLEKLNERTGSKIFDVEKCEAR